MHSDYATTVKAAMLFWLTYAGLAHAIFLFEQPLAWWKMLIFYSGLFLFPAALFFLFKQTPDENDVQLNNQILKRRLVTGAGFVIAFALFQWVGRQYFDGINDNPGHREAGIAVAIVIWGALLSSKQGTFVRPKK